VPRKAARKQAIATLVTMAGTILLSRVAGSGELSDEVMKAGKEVALENARREPAKAAAVKKTREKQN
jgi:TetR/AcrR family transcriptional repressor of nem operon